MNEVVSYSGEMKVGEGDEPDEASMAAAREILDPLLPMIASHNDPDALVSIAVSVLVTAALRFADTDDFIDAVRQAARESLVRAKAEIAVFGGPRL